MFFFGRYGAAMFAMFKPKGEGKRLETGDRSLDLETGDRRQETGDWTGPELNNELGTPGDLE